MMADFLVVGSGIAGLSFALRAAHLGRVVIVTKKKEIDSATNLAQGGIAAVLSTDDSYDLHIEDTLRSGAGLCDKKVVEFVVREGPDRVRELIDIGVNFVCENADNESRLDLGKEGGHSRRRVAHAYDLTGREIERALINKVKKNSNITLLENHICVDLLIKKASSETAEDRCVGAYVLHENVVEVYQAGLTVLCTGGAGKVYLYTSNPDIATGDGIAMAFRAGAQIANMEFFQFHPTCLYHHHAKNFLISEAVRGEGGYLRDANGSRFMAKYDPDRMELATRDTVARAIDKEMKETGADCVYLDISHKDKAFIRQRFPTIHEYCLRLGIDITEKPMPVVPAAHYLCGGVLTDEYGRSTINGLFALGETACTGLHGGNRLASNSLLEAVVYAERAFRKCQEEWEYAKSTETDSVDPWKTGSAVNLDEEILINHNWDLLRRIMWNYVGIVRSERRLKLAEQRVSEILKEIEQHYKDFHISPGMVELRNIACVAKLIIHAARVRKESRGLHYILDYPEARPDLTYWNIFRRKKLGTGEPWHAEIVGKKDV
jgi:L-aspartate oxidase